MITAECVGDGRLSRSDYAGTVSFDYLRQTHLWRHYNRAFYRHRLEHGVSQVLGIRWQHEHARPAIQTPLLFARDRSNELHAPLHSKLIRQCH